ncbi:MAG: cyclic nucleotide-binding domain-containing protein [Deltaproteobacteria bacterium]|nr:cyclic nucleotide-binding domain-containing protein [Deltaproteobacteria bacterium]
MLTAAETEFLQRVGIFAAIPPAGMARLGALARRVDIAGPSLVFAEGEPAQEMVVVLKGMLEVRKRGRSGSETRIAVLRPGDIAGEMSLIDIQPRSAAVRSLGTASLVVLTHADLAQFYREDPSSYAMLVLNIAREISRRLRRVDALLADILVGVQDLWAGAMAEAAGTGTGRTGGGSSGPASSGGGSVP